MSDAASPPGPPAGPHTAPASLQIAGLCGSLRSGSFNGMALALAGRSMPPGMRLQVLDWRAVPPFDADRMAQGLPAPVAALRACVQRADGLLIATPEYNFSVPGMLKNLLDWLSRGADQPLAGKPVALLSAATGPLGGARVQYELRRVLPCTDALVLPKPEVFIGRAQDRFAPDGSCTDPATRNFVALQMRAFAQWIARARSAAAVPG